LEKTLKGGKIIMKKQNSDLPPAMLNLSGKLGGIETRAGKREETYSPEWGPEVRLNGKLVGGEDSFSYKQPTRVEENADTLQEQLDTYKYHSDVVFELGLPPYPVKLIAQLSLYQARNLLWGFHNKVSGYTDNIPMKSPITFLIHYPLNTGVKLMIYPPEKSKHGVERNGTLGYTLWLIAREYKRIYQKYKKYGVWGHQITGLVFEGLTIYENGFAEILIGS